MASPQAPVAAGQVTAEITKAGAARVPTIAVDESTQPRLGKAKTSFELAGVAQ